MPTTRSQTSTPVPTPPSAFSSPAADSTRLRHRPRVGSRSHEVFDAKYAVDLATRTVDENVFLFVPNLIGYARIILAGGSLYYMPKDPKMCMLLYSISCLLDAADGTAARMLDQSSKFGAVLDMVTDRCTTACLLCYLASAFPSWALMFQFLISLDFSSHYIHMYSSSATGAVSHKKIGQDVSWILWMYYNNKATLFTFCFCNELFFVSLYLCAHDHSTPWFHLFGYAFTWPVILALVNFPIMFGKQVINCVQFWKASKILVGIDLQERQKKRDEELKKQAENGAAVVI